MNAMLETLTLAGLPQKYMVAPDLLLKLKGEFLAKYGPCFEREGPFTLLGCELITGLQFWD